MPCPDPRPSPARRPLFGAIVCLACCLGWAGASWAEKADREQPMVLESDNGGSVDLQKQIAVYQGKVVIEQGSLRINADKVEVRQDKAGHRQATAWGLPNQPVTLFQRLDTPGETLEGVADKLEQDSRTDTLKLMGKARLKRLKNGQTMDDIQGAVITWQNGREVFTVDAGTAPGTTGGRVRAVIAPREPASGSKP